MTREELKTSIKETVIRSIISYCRKNLNKRRSFQVLDLLIPKERKIRSIVGGLETSLGRTLWEPLAKTIARLNGFEVINSNLQAPSNIPGILDNTIQNILNERNKTNGIYDFSSSRDEIKRVCQTFVTTPLIAFEAAPKGHGVDIWLKKDGINYFFDTKTVQPNVGGFKALLSQVIHWYAFFYSKYPTEQAVCRIVFPYNPYNGNFWLKSKANGKPLTPIEEAWVEDEFWNFLSGVEGTFDIIKESLVEINDEGTLEQQLEELFRE